MAMYFCNHCDTYVDNDWHPCEPDPDSENDHICPGCADNIRCEECESLTVQIDIDYVNDQWQGIRECPKCDTNNTTT